MGVELRSLENALRVLETLAESTGDVRITELAKRTRLSKAGVFRILATLERRGYVGQDPMTKRYRLGMRGWQLGCAAVRDLQLNDVARPALERLVAAVHETAVLGVPVGDEIMIVDRVDAPRAVRIYSRIGDRAPLHATSLGKIILAFRDAETWQSLPARLERYTERTIVRREALVRELEAARRNGVALNVGEWSPEVSGVAACVFDRTAQPIAAVNVSVPTERAESKLLAECGRVARDAAAEISRKLGSPRPVGAPRADGGSRRPVTAGTMDRRT